MTAAARPLATVADDDQLWPRVPDFRYRLYALKGGVLRVLAAAPDPGGVGAAIVQLHEDERAAGGRLADLGAIGILDVLPDRPRATGEWIVLPWSRPTHDSIMRRRKR